MRGCTAKNPAIGRDEALRRLASGGTATKSLVAALNREQQRVIRRLIEAYQALQPSQQQEIVEAESSWFSYLDTLGKKGSREPYESMVAALVPGAFAAFRDGSREALPPVRTVDPVEDLRWLPDELYHGSRASLDVMTRGFWLPPASRIGNATYTWKMHGRQDPSGYPIDWGSIVWHEWWKKLTPEGRKSLRRQSGVNVRSKDDLGDAISLLWTFDRVGRSAFSYADSDVVLTIDPRKLSIYGFIEADEAGKGETVLILSSYAPQGAPDAIIGAWTKD